MRINPKVVKMLEADRKERENYFKGNRPMTNELTLREKACADIANIVAHPGYDKEALDRIAFLLEDTGSPAHMRVAKELRGE